MRWLVLALSAASVAALVGATVVLVVPSRPISGRRRVAFLLCPLSQLAVALFSLALYATGTLGMLSAACIAVCSLICPALDVAIFRALAASEETGLARQEAEAAREQYEAQLAHARRVRETCRSLEELRAEARGRLEALTGALDEGDLEAAERLLGSGADEKGTEQCDHVVAAALLSMHERRCAELGIGWSCRAEIPRDVGLTPVEVGMLLSNLLGNAVGAAHASDAETPFVRVGARVSRGCLAVRVENSCAPGARVPERARGDDLPEHGWGRQIVASIARDHDGEVREEVRDGTWRTDVVVPLG